MAIFLGYTSKMRRNTLSQHDGKGSAETCERLQLYIIIPRCFQLYKET